MKSIAALLILSLLPVYGLGEIRFTRRNAAGNYVVSDTSVPVPGTPYMLAINPVTNLPGFMPMGWEFKPGDPTTSVNLSDDFYDWMGSEYMSISDANLAIADMQGEIDSISLTPGPQGPTGPTGAAGTNGTNGADGATGPTGPKGDPGEDGIDGVNGLDGIDGEQGPQGVAGNDGAKGDKGDRGDTGLQGIQGIQGLTGAKGDTGSTGSAGPKGDTGDQGPIGLTGAPGAAATNPATLLGTVNVTETAVVAIAAGVRKVTVTVSGVVVGGNYLLFPTGSTPAGYALADVVATGANTLQVTITVPLIVLGGSYTIPCRVVRINY